MAKDGPKRVLRIGLIQNDRVVEESVIRRRSSVSIGRNEQKNDLVLPVSDLPDSQMVFKAVGGRYAVLVTEDMAGQISYGNGAYDIWRLIDEGKAKKTEAGYLIPLTPECRGKLAIGDVVVLFQFVAPPPALERPKLPRSLRGGWFQDVNTELVVLLLMSMVLQVGFVSWLVTQDFPVPKEEKGKVMDQFVEVLNKDDKKEEPELDKKEPEQKEKEKTDDKKKVDKNKKKKKAKKKSKPKKEPKKEESEEQRRKKLTKEVEKKTVLSAIGTDSKEGGSVVDSLDKGVDKKSMEEAWEGSQGVETDGTSGNNLQTSGSTEGSGTGQSAGIGDLEQTSAAEKAEKSGGTGDVGKERQVQANIDIKSDAKIAEAKGVLDPQSVSRVIKQKYSNLRSCYVQYLNTNPGAGGKIEVEFKISPRGRVSSSRATTNTVGGTVGACVARKIRYWRFPKPEGGTVTFRKTFVFESSN